MVSFAVHEERIGSASCRNTVLCCCGHYGLVVGGNIRVDNSGGQEIVAAVQWPILGFKDGYRSPTRDQLATATRSNEILITTIGAIIRARSELKINNIVFYKYSRLCIWQDACNLAATLRDSKM